MVQQAQENKKEPDDGNALQPPPIVPPKRKTSKPKITLKMPPISPQLTTIYSPGIGLNIPLTPATGFAPNLTVNVFEAYPNKTQEFIFKQFAGFKDFTMNTGKIGLSFGEKMVFWTYGKVRQLSTNNFTHIFLFFLVVAYCLLGGILFHLAERGTEDDNIRKAKREMDHFVNYTIGVVTAEHCQKSLTAEGRKNITTELINLIFGHGNNLKKLSVPTMVDYIYFSGTVFTTIGYGHMSPDTNPGKFITIIYSLFGIPMFLILLADYGKLFTRGIKYIWAFVRRLYYTGSCRNVRRTAPVQEMMKGMQMVYDMTKLRRPSTMVDENCAVELNKENETQASPTATPALSAYTIDDEFNLPISVAFTILVVYMVGGALFFSHTEDWEFFKAFYFVYISISTIGFGDIVPRSQWFLMLVSLVYFVFGLALTSMCINVVQEKLSDSIRQASAKLGARIGFEETEEENDANKLQVPVAE